MSNNKTEFTAREFYIKSQAHVLPYIIDEKTVKPMLRVSRDGEIFFYCQEEKFVLTIAERHKFEKANSRKFDYHYEN